METSILQIAGSLGVGALLAVVIALLSFRFISNTTGKIREDRKYMEDRLTKLLEDDQKSREENTRVLGQLCILIERLNGRH